MQPRSYTQCVLRLPFFLSLASIVTCLVPIDPSPSGPPPSIQLRPASIIKTSATPLGASSGRGRTGSTIPTSFLTLQLNLCNSGVASCYAGGDSIPEGAELIYATGPNGVTGNEICSDDVPALQASLREAWPTDYTYSVSTPR